MPENLEQMLQQAGNAAPAPAPADNPPGTGGAAAPNGIPAPAPAGDADELPTGLREYLAANPDHKAVVDLVNREMKSAWTPKLQEAAELRKLTEGLDQQSIQQFRELRRLAQENPAQLAQWMRQQAEFYAPSTSAAQPAAASSDFQPVTEGEAVLWRQLQELAQWRQQAEQKMTQTQLSAQAQAVNQEINALQQQYGVEISLPERAQAWQYAQAAGIPVAQAIWAVAGAKLSEASARRARDEAAGVVQTKQNMAAGNPGSIVPRTETAENAPRDLRSILARELEAAGIGD